MISSLRTVAALVVAAGLAVACESTPLPASPSTTVAPTTTIPGGSTPAETKAATVRAQLTASFVSEVYLSAIATSAVATGGSDTAVQTALSQNAADVAAVVGDAWGPAAGGQFPALWLRYSAGLVDYAKAKAAGDSAALASAKNALDSFTSDLAAFIGGLDINLTAKSISDDFTADIAAQEIVVDAQVAKDPTQYSKLAAAAALIPHTADLVGAGMAKQAPTRFPGTAAGSASDLRAQLTAELASNVYLLSITTATQRAGGAVAPPRDALDASSGDLADAFAANFGEPAGKGFLDRWQRLTNALIGYAATGTGAPSSTDVTSFAASLLPKLDQTQFSQALGSALDAEIAFLDAQRNQSSSQVDAERSAADAMAPVAQTLAETIAEQFPDRYKA